MSNDLRYDGRVVVITGAGNGLGRSHALLFGARGAKVVVNDLGGGAHGGGKSSAAADKVVDEIRSAGGEAVANYDSVEDGDKIVQTALDHFGRIDVLINNAGILRDASFAKMTDEDWDLIYRVHLRGSYKVSHAAWPHMRAAGYGRIIMTTSSAGIYGNFGQANYSAMKLALLGLGNTLSHEGRAKNVNVNTIAPIAGSRLTETVMPADVVAALKPEFVSPLVAWLAHEDCSETGGLFEVGAGFMGKLRWERTLGHNFRGRSFSPEDVAAKWEKITDFAEANHPANVNESFGPIMAEMGKPGKGGNEFIDADEATSAAPIEMTSSYDERDVSLYALGIGAARNPAEESELGLVYELNNDGFHVLPTYGVMPSSNAFLKLAQQGHKFPGCNFGFDRILHGEQFTEIVRPMPPRAKLSHKTRVKDVFDKGKNALITYATETFDEAGDLLAYNEMTAVVRGAGGWGGDRGPSVEVNVPPDRAPDAVIEEKTDENQTLLYRLSGDWNPLHADPAFARAFGFDKPILHGLCFFGYAGRHVVKAFCGNDPRRFKNIKVRFADSVFPGETLVTEMWKESDNRIVFRMKVKERDKVVLSNAAVELYSEIPKAKAKTAAPSAVAAAPVAGPSTADVFAAIGAYVEKTPGLAAKVGTVYQWNITGPNSNWVLDLKNGAGSCKPGVAEKPDCTIAVAESDFIDLCSGKADAQKLYFGGKLKITGNIMASQKLGFLKDVRIEAGAAGTAPAAAAPAEAEAAPVQPRTGPVFAAIAARLKAGAEVGGVLQFNVHAPDAAWVIDPGKGTVSEGRADAPAATIGIDDEDLLALAQGAVAARDLFQKGKLKVDGDIRVAHRLDALTRLN
ncbi:SDR family NAD(P)-dependent oxidoreductase [Oleomonas cavernae]|uniref:SDR family NAD(P)-dependent oxidoreductase n=1 Tax=Oleomonas cavernae TaxID=2320859 RepID=A0A418WTP0_9PROT|nr:peroxisomal multifunctional enzyme type 2 [Oleomonas cavernae]RJF94595.1 SDR family NAD(P)-dependent oxidoreductase [Oleomonas cavernae]